MTSRRSQGAAVGRKRQELCADPAGRLTRIVKLSPLLTCGHFPNSNQLVIAARGQRSTVGRQNRAVHRSLVAGKSPDESIARQFPERDRADFGIVVVGSFNGQNLAVGERQHASDLVRRRGMSRQQLAGDAIPDSDCFASRRRGDRLTVGREPKVGADARMIGQRLDASTGGQVPDKDGMIPSSRWLANGHPAKIALRRFRRDGRSKVRTISPVAVFQTWTAKSKTLHVAANLPSGLKTNVDTPPVCPGPGLVSWPLETDHKRMALPAPPTAIVALSGLIASAIWPRNGSPNDRMTFPLSIERTCRATVSIAPPTSTRPKTLPLAAMAGAPANPSQSRRHFSSPLATFQQRTVRSVEEVTANAPSALKRNPRDMFSVPVQLSDLLAVG